jgi:hypothetical protein
VKSHARDLAAPAFPGDDGSAPPSVAAALAAYDADPATGHPAALAELQDSRLLVPVVATLGDVEHDADGLAHDKSSDMAAVLLTGADGRLALLAFTGLDALRRWDPTARPVPVAAALAARAAVQDDAAALVVDVAGPVTYVVEGEDLHGLAAGWTVTRVGGRPAWMARIGPAPE